MYIYLKNILNSSYFIVRYFSINHLNVIFLKYMSLQKRKRPVSILISATPDRESFILIHGEIVWFSNYSVQHDPQYYP